jgi:two-component system, NtrC family, sensor kinase
MTGGNDVSSMTMEPRSGLALSEAASVDARALELDLQQTRQLAAIGQLTAGVAHEINTPLQYIGDNISFLEVTVKRLLELAGSFEQLIEACKAGAPTREDLERYERELSKSRIGFLRKQAPLALEQSTSGVDQVRSIVQALKEFSHPGSDQLVEVDLNQLARNASTVTRNAWRYQAELSLELADELPAVQGNPQSLGQVLINLIVNAADAIESSASARAAGELGKIAIRSRVNGSGVELEVADNGGGIPESIREKVMQPFFTTKRAGKGTGQGLALAHSTIVEQHAGKFFFTSDEGRGTSFFIQLPLGGAPQ